MNQPCRIFPTMCTTICFPFIGKVWPTRRHNKLCRNWGGIQSLQLQQVSSALSGGFHQGNREAAKQLLGCYWCGLQSLQLQQVFFIRYRTCFLSGDQCFGSIFIKSRSSQKSQSGSRKDLNPDPDPSYFFTLSSKSQLKERML